MSSPDNTAQFPAAAIATLAWEQLAERVEAFLAAWQTSIPTVADFAPAEPPELRHLILVELIKVDLEYRWADRKSPRTIEEYVADFPELAASGGVPCDLIYEEYHVRRQFGDKPDAADYFVRFPQQVEQLRRLLGLEESHLTTTLVRAEKSEEVDVGQQIDDFDLLTKLGKGAFASVFLARQRSMQRLVALKVSADRGSEAQTLAQLDHPNIVRVYDQRQLPEKKLRLLYMQHIPGGTLLAVVHRLRQTPAAARSGRILLDAVDASLLDRGESPPAESGTRRRLAAATWPEAVCWLGARLAAALEYAHRQGILHRDVKPANVLLAADGSPKLADFNVSFSSKLDGATPAAYFGGSLAYMSPEQLEAADPDHARKPEELDGQSDVYSLAVMLWELLSGTRPFGDEMFEGSWAETLKKMTGRRRQGVGPSAIALLPRDMPQGLERVLLSCLSSNTAERPATAGHLARQLELCLQPRVQRLLMPQSTGWRQWVRQQPIVSYVILAFLPQVLFGYFNLQYNAREIMERLSASDQSFFWNVQVPTVNLIAYPVGFALAFSLSWPVLQAVQRKVHGIKQDTTHFTELRRRSLWLGDQVTWIAMSLWIVTGIVFPLWLWMHAGPESVLQMRHCVHFLVSQLLTGVIASTETFFLVAFVSVRSMYPLLFQTEANQENESRGLAGLGQRCIWYFGLAVSAPFIALMFMALMDTQYRVIIGALAALGFVGSLLAFRLLRTVQGDLTALAFAIDPNRDPMTSSETVDSFWSGSR